MGTVDYTGGSRSSERESSQREGWVREDFHTQVTSRPSVKDN